MRTFCLCRVNSRVYVGVILVFLVHKGGEFGRASCESEEVLELCLEEYKGLNR